MLRFATFNKINRLKMMSKINDFLTGFFYFFFYYFFQLTESPGKKCK